MCVHVLVVDNSCVCVFVLIDDSCTYVCVLVDNRCVCIVDGYMYVCMGVLVADVCACISC